METDEAELSMIVCVILDKKGRKKKSNSPKNQQFLQKATWPPSGNYSMWRSAKFGSSLSQQKKISSCKQRWVQYPEETTLLQQSYL